jgi:hypothetical protein
MKPLLFVGLILIAAGGFVVFRGLNYTSQRSVLKLGEFEASLEEKRAIPAWAGAIAIAGGLALVVVGARRRG